MTGLWQRHRWAEGLLLVLLAGADVAGAQPSAAGMRPLVVPLEHPIDVQAGQAAQVSFSYQSGDPVNALRPIVKLTD